MFYTNSMEGGMNMLTAKDVAKYFLSKVDSSAGDLISNLKLQKLVYYAQGLHLAMLGTPLFKADIEAWEHGPVVPSLYHTYKHYESGPIPPPADLDIKQYDKKTREYLDEIYDVFNQFSALKLRELTHSEDPWKKTNKGEVISHELMQKYLKKYLTKE